MFFFFFSKSKDEYMKHSVEKYNTSRMKYNYIIFIRLNFDRNSSSTHAIT